MTTSKRLAVSAILGIAMVSLIGCGGSIEQTGQMTKEEAKSLGKADWWDDLCELYGWYGDGICDTFCPLPDTEDCGPSDHRPVCDMAGSEGAGWYWADTEGFILADDCGGKSAPECVGISSRSQGWASDSGLITWDNQCHRTVGIALWGETCGGSIGQFCYQEFGLYCQGLPDNGLIGGTGICKENGTCETAADCTAEGNEWTRPRCPGYAECLANNTCEWHCDNNSEGVWSWTTTLLAEVESDHPYQSNLDWQWVIKREGASRIKIHISRMELEYGYDWVTVSGTASESALILEGSDEDFWTPEFEGDTLYVTLHSDSTVTYWGFEADAVSYMELLEPGFCNSSEDCGAGEVCYPNTCINAFAPCYGECRPGEGGQQGDPCQQNADCDQELFCKQMTEGAGTCQTELWCASSTVDADCANVVHIMVPGSWACEDSQCAWQTEMSGGTFFPADTPLGIPDNNVEGITSEIDVAGLPACSLSVSLNVTVRHSYSGDLVIGLTDPAGSRVVLHNREGAGTDDVTIQGLSLTGTLGSQGGNGKWILDASDHASLDSGTLESWSITLLCE